MRRRLAALLAVVALLLVPSLAAAQFQYGPGGGIIVSTDQVSASGQVATAQSLIPSSIITTQTSLCITQHCLLDVTGVLSTANASAGTLTVTYSYGGVSMTVVSARSLETGLNTVPFRLQCIVSPNATIAATVGKTTFCNFDYVPSNTAGTTPITFLTTTTGSITFTATQTQAATFTFSDVTTSTGAIARRQWFGAGS